MTLAAAYLLGPAARPMPGMTPDRDPRREDLATDRLAATVEDEISHLGQRWARFTPELEHLYDTSRIERRRRAVRALLRMGLILVAMISLLHSVHVAGALRPLDVLHVLISAVLILLCRRAVGHAGSATLMDRTVAVALVGHLLLTAILTLIDRKLGNPGFVAVRPLELTLLFAGCSLLCLPQRAACVTLGLALCSAAASLMAAGELGGTGGPFLAGLVLIAFIAFAANRLMDEAARESFLMRLRADLQLRRSEADRTSMERLASLDPLTGIPNRRAFDAELARTLAGSDSDNAVLLAFIDVDHFKTYNDFGGHALGDECLRRVAASLRAAVGTGFLARYGGEEFAVILQGDTTQALEAGVHRLHQAVRALQTPHPGRSDGIPHVTISIGAGHHVPGEPGHVLMERVDRSLYRAKALGRDQVVMASDATGDQVVRLRSLRRLADAESPVSAPPADAHSDSCSRSGRFGGAR